MKGPGGGGILQYLEDRRLNRRPGRHAVHSAIAPTMLISDIVLPYRLDLVKFTHDGTILVGLTWGYPGIVAFDYLGVEVLAGVTAAPHDPFHRAFRVRYHVNTADMPGSGIVRREVFTSVVLFTEQDRYVLLLKVHQKEQDLWLDDDDRGFCYINEYSIVVVRVATGHVVERVPFQTEKARATTPIMALFEDTLAVLSVQHQVISMYRVGDNGTLHFMQNIGQFCYPDGRRLVEQLGPFEFDSGVYSGLLHRLLAHLWRESGTTPQQRLFRYYTKLPGFLRLKMTSLQFISSEVFLIRFDYLAGVNEDGLFVFYNYVTTEIEASYDERDPIFQDMIRDRIHDFLLPTLHPNQRRSFIMENSTSTLRRLHEYYTCAVRTHVPERWHRNHSNAVVLPFICQNVHVSPYLDAAVYLIRSGGHIPPDLISIDCRYLGQKVLLLTRQFQGVGSSEVNVIGGRGAEASLLPGSSTSYVLHPTDPLIITNVANSVSTVDMLYRVPPKEEECDCDDILL